MLADKAEKDWKTEKRKRKGEKRGEQKQEEEGNLQNQFNDFKERRYKNIKEKKVLKN